MKILLQKGEYNFLIEMLDHVDKRSYDPVYKNLIERIEKTADMEGFEHAVYLEESEIYNVLDAANEYVDEAENGNYEEDERESRVATAEDFAELLSEETGITL